MVQQQFDLGESFQNAESKKFAYVHMSTRVEDRPLPAVEIVPAGPSTMADLLAGGGFTVSGNASVTGNGIMLYNTGTILDAAFHDTIANDRHSHMLRL
jgi:hypothetical protein